VLEIKLSKYYMNNIGKSLGFYIVSWRNSYCICFSSLITAEKTTVLYNVSWETFEAYLRDTAENRGSRFAYDYGTLESYDSTVWTRKPENSILQINIYFSRRIKNLN
jgi:hypothetical protein